MYNPSFTSKEEENDFNKTRVDSLGLSVRTANVLVDANIRTVGGILRNNDASLLSIKGLGQRGIKEIDVALHLVLQNSEGRTDNNQIQLSENIDISKDRDFSPADHALAHDIKKRKDLKLEELIKRTKSGREISERDKKILEIYREGTTLMVIADSFSLTYQRVRQIVEKTIKQIAINEAIQSGVSVDFAEMAKHEKEKRDLAKRFGRKERTGKKFRYEWSRNYASCKTCNTTSIPHFINGLCESCGSKSINGEAREKMIAEHENECDLCGISRNDSRIKYERDFYLSRTEKSVLCMKCHRLKTGKKLGDIKRNKWRMFYK